MPERHRKTTPGGPRRAARIAAPLCVLALSLAAFPSLASAASSPPSLASAFSPTVVGAGSLTPAALSYTLTNPNASSALSGVGFTDTLPAGLTIDDPNGLSGNCGSAGTITAAAGTQTVSLSGGAIKAGSTCTFSVSVTAAHAGTFSDTPGAPSSSAGTGTTGPAATLVVLPPPTVTVSAPTANAKLAYGQTARARFTCAQPADPAALAGCLASDDQGNPINPGGRLDTKAPGTHTLTVDATSQDGLVTEQNVTYTVLPDNRFTVPKPRATRAGVLKLTLTLPGPGRLVAVATSGRLRFALSSVRIDAARRLVLRLHPTAAGAARLARATAGGPAAMVHLRLQVTYTPKGGDARTITVRGITVG